MNVIDVARVALAPNDVAGAGNCDAAAVDHDVAQAFTTNAIDAMVTSPSTGVNSQSWDYITHFTTINAWIPKNMMFVNRKVFNRLDDETKQVILTAAANAEKLAVEHTNMLEENGMIVSAPTPKLQEELRAIGKVMVTEWLEEAGAAGKAVVDAYNDL